MKKYQLTGQPIYVGEIYNHNGNLQLATAGAAASGMSVTNIGGASSRTFVQNIYSHDALSPAEMSTEAMAAMERDKWRLP